MKIRIPSLAKKENAEMASVIETAARRAGISDHEMLRLSTHLFEVLSDEISRGKIVTVPGFGKFAAIYLKHFRARAGVMRARFSPSYALINQVRLCCPITTKGNRSLKLHEKNHAYLSNTRPAARPFSAAEALRLSIASQMGED